MNRSGVWSSSPGERCAAAEANHDDGALDVRDRVEPGPEPRHGLFQGLGDGASNPAVGEPRVPVALADGCANGRVHRPGRYPNSEEVSSSLEARPCSSTTRGAAGSLGPLHFAVGFATSFIRCPFGVGALYFVPAEARWRPWCVARCSASRRMTAASSVNSSNAGFWPTSVNSRSTMRRSSPHTSSRMRRIQPVE